MTVAVVGGGIAGLAAAVWSAEAGAEVTLLEASPVPGGKLARRRLGDLDVDTGAESMLARTPPGLRPEVVDLLSSLGLEPARPAPVPAQLLIDGTVRRMPRSMLGVPVDVDDLAEVCSTAGLDRARREPVDAGPWPADAAIGEVVEQRLGSEVVDRLLEPMLGGVYAGHARRLSFPAVSPALWDRARAGGSLVAAAASLMPARVPGAPAPASPLVGVTGGVAAVVDGLIERLRAAGATVRTEACVRGLERRPGGWRLRYGPTTDERTLDVDQVVLGVPAAPLARLLADVIPEPLIRRLAAVPYASVAVLAVLVRGLAIEGSGLLVPPGGLPTIKAFTHSTRKWPWLRERVTAAHGADTELVRISIGRAGNETRLQLPDAELIMRTLEEARTAPGWASAEVIDARLHRWGGGLPQYEVGHLALTAELRRALEGVGGISACGALWDGVGIAGCLRSARAAVAALQDDHGHIRVEQGKQKGR